MESSCGWICNPVIVWLDEFVVVWGKNSTEEKNPQNVQGLALYLGVVPGL